MVVEWTATERSYGDEELCVHELLERQAKRRADGVAVACGGGSLSYGELERRSNGLGHRLRRMGVGPEVRVGLCVERSLLDRGGDRGDPEGGRSIRADGAEPA